MAEFSLDELKQIMRECAGEGESGNLDDDFEAVTFDHLGYDSLAVLETASRIERTYGLKLPEEELAEITTPGSLVAFVNDRLREKV
ncbi:MAG: acyl carrier protein [Pseudonocardiaceae bacterium]